MSYVHTTLKPLGLPRKCPVCHEGRKDAAAIAIHNDIASRTGCRAYLEDKR